MINHTELTAGKGRFKVTLFLQETGGHGLCCFLTGGERPHVGGTVLASLSERVNGGGMTCNLCNIPLPGHKDSYLAEKLAKTLCLATNQPVAITAGLHVDNASEEDIQLLVSNGCDTVAQYLQLIGKEG